MQKNSLGIIKINISLFLISSTLKFAFDASLLVPTSISIMKRWNRHIVHLYFDFMTLQPDNGFLSR